MIEILSNSDEYWREIARLRQQRIDSLEKVVGLFLASQGIVVEIDETLDDLILKVNKLDTLRDSQLQQKTILLRRERRKKTAWKVTAITSAVAGTAAVIYYRFIWSR